MNTDTDLKWIDEDYTRFEKYDFTKGAMLEIKAFMDAKKEYLTSPCAENKVAMKQHFLYAHSNLKAECSRHKISPVKLDELTELLRKGV